MERRGVLLYYRKLEVEGFIGQGLPYQYSPMTAEWRYNLLCSLDEFHATIPTVFRYLADILVGFSPYSSLTCRFGTKQRMSLLAV